MPHAAIPENEPFRLQVLQSLEVLDTPPDPTIDSITRLAASICEASMAAVSLVDENRQWFKSKVGVDADQTSREAAFCAHTILGDTVLEVVDATVDPRFADSPLVLEDPKIRFYAGAPLMTSEGVSLGALCVMDRIPRKLDSQQLQSLSYLSALVVGQLQLQHDHDVLTMLTSELEQAKERQLVQFALTKVLAESETLEIAATGLLREICRHGSWDLGEIWLVHREAKGMRLLKMFSESDLDYSVLLSESADLLVRPGMGLPGRVWNTGKPEWFEFRNSGASSLRKSSRAAGIEASCAFPITSSNEFIGALCLSSCHPHKPASEFFALMEDFGKQIGQFIERKQAENALRRRERQYRNLVDNSLGLICTHDLTGTLLSVNPAACAAMGVPIDSWRGQNIQSTLSPEVAFRFDHYMSRLLDKGQVSGIMHVRHSDGRPRVWAFHNVMVREAGEGPFILGHAQDITERIDAEKALKENEARLRTLAEMSPNGILIYSDRKIIYANRAVEEISGYSVEEITATSIGDTTHPDDRPAVEQRITDMDMLSSDRAIEPFEYRVIRKDGTERWVESRSAVIQYDGKRAVLVVASDITDRKRVEDALIRAQERLRVALEKEKDLSRSDFLTGVSNRRAFYEIGEFEANRCRRNKRPISLAYIDLDNFKNVNDTKGHEAGDDLLVSVASTVKQSVRASDVVARLGGDEFAILFSESTAYGSKVIVEKLRRQLLQEMQSHGWPVTFSIGLITFSESYPPFEDMIRQADELMYTVKNNGKTRIATAIGA